MHKSLFICLFCFVAQFSFAGKVDTVSIYSQAMHRSFQCVVIMPDKVNKGEKQFPAVYLLHGYSGSYNNWIRRVPQLADYATTYQTIIVCPEGGFSSWYLDSPVDSTMRYETYIAKEVPDYIDAHYPTLKDRRARAITGLSMGGHGGLFLGFRHADLFGACGSMSGGVNLYATRNRFDLIKRIGDTVSNRANWDNYSVIHVVEHYPKDSLAIIFDCGVTDFFYADNQQLHAKMLQLKIPHDYIERPGQHDWNYWANAVQYQLLYFRNFFDKTYGTIIVRTAPAKSVPLKKR